MKARVIVTLKGGVLDPQGKAIEGALRSLGVEGISAVRQGKVFDIALDGATHDAAQAALSSACERLLANTVVENFHIDLEAGSDELARIEPRSAERESAGGTAAAEQADEAGEAAEMPAEGHP